MSLDWGRGFGTDLRAAPGATQPRLSASFRTLCFSAPAGPAPFPLCIDRRRLLCAQIPGVQPDETHFIDLLARAPEATVSLLDFISAERIFLRDVTFLRGEVLPALETGPFARVHRALWDLLAQIHDAHRRLLDALEDLASRNPPAVLAVFVDILAGFDLAPHEQYTGRFLQLEPLAVALSCQRSQQALGRLGGRVLLQVLKAPVAWQRDSAAIARALVAALRAEGDTRARLEEFARRADKLCETVDSIPRLEAIARRVMNSPFQIPLPGRRVLREGAAKKHCRKNVAKREVILFSDVFMYAQQKGKHLMSVGDYALTQLRIAVPDPDGTCLCVYSPKKSFVLEFATHAEMAAWRDAFGAAIPNARDSADPAELVEADEAPIWVPDSATKTCQDCKEKFTTIRRRHHCRRCGNIYCSDCLPYKVVIPGISDKPVVCCKDCYRRIQSVKK
jgi:hypothetical protein